MRTSLWQLGFRPFFFLGSLHAVGVIAIWLLFLTGRVSRLAFSNPILWHSHEMVYGFTASIIAGFVLTAAQNWTGKPGIKGRPLQLIVGIWLLARILLLIPSVPSLICASVDLLFFPVLAVLMMPYLRDPDLKMERIFYVFFAFFFIGNLLVHLENLNLLSGFGRMGIRLGLNTVLLVIIFIGGRVIPFFTESSIAKRQPKTYSWVEWLAPASAALFLIIDFFSIDSRARAGVAFFAAAIHGIRLQGWYVKRIQRIPLLWILHLGYLWLVLGFTLSGLASLGHFPISAAAHAFTVGAVGLIIYGMISRVSLGHTGRRLHPSAWIVAGYFALNMAAGARVLGPFLFPTSPNLTFLVSGGFWCLGFLLYLALYARMLFSPRVDGRPG